MNSYGKIVQSTHDRQGNPVAVDSEYLLIYYAADWCPYCVEYAEELKEQYNQYKRMYGNRLEIIFAGHVNDQSDENLLAFLDQGSYSFPYILSSSNGASKKEYLRDRPLYALQTLLSIDCAVCTQ
jgi:thiol-disulfide isomerase/thioredoxin